MITITDQILCAKLGLKPRLDDVSIHSRHHPPTDSVPADKGIPLEKILETNGFDSIDGALWFAQALDKKYIKAVCLYACFCVRWILPLVEQEFPEDQIPRNTLEITERFIRGETSWNELIAAARVAVKCSDISIAHRAVYGLTYFYNGTNDIFYIVYDAACYYVLAENSVLERFISIREIFSKEFIRLCRLDEEYGKLVKDNHKANSR
jgi:hypothetical protein